VAGYIDSKPKTTCFVHTANAGPIDNIPGIKVLDEFFQTRCVAER
jgi:hypothetical protein